MNDMYLFDDWDHRVIVDSPGIQTTYTSSFQHYLGSLTKCQSAYKNIFGH